jgi:hypothetical protein
MKKVIERLERVLRIIPSITVDNWVSNDGLATVKSLTEEAIAELQSPRWYTPEQWERRTGKPWPDNGAVYCKCRYDFAETWSDWRIKSLGDAIWESSGFNKYQIVCATESGPPPDSWRPEEMP